MLLAAFALLVALRLPRTWIHGRFLDEEATVFLAYAWHHPWLEALFRSFAGYLNVGATASTMLVARLVQGGLLPLEYAPYVTMMIALAIQLLPAILVLTGRARWLDGRIAVIAALLFIAISPATEEVFLNVMHIQFHLALCAALILAFEPPQRPAAIIGYWALLFFAPLCGPGAIVILPLFALRWLIDRDPGRLRQLVAFATSAIIQLSIFYGPSPVRGHLFDPGTIAATMFVRLIALPALGFRRAQHIGTAIYESQASGGYWWWWSAAATVMLFGALLFVASRRKEGAIWLLLSALVVAVASFGFGMVIEYRIDLFSIGSGERYGFLPLVLLGLTLTALAMRPGARHRPIFALLCTVMLVTGGFRYRKPLAPYAQGPAWSDEVAAWRLDHRHPLAVWPAPWTANLSDEVRPCSPIREDRTQSTDPRYCESGWVAGFLRQQRAQYGGLARAAP